MKYVIFRCEDYAPVGAQSASLLDGAKTSHLQQLAQAGAAGLVRARKGHLAIDRFQLHRALFGFGPRDAEALPASCYAASKGLKLSADETVWCCELMTQQDGKVLDPTSGHITTKESEVLIRSLNEQLSSETRRWELGDGSHHMLVMRDRALAQIDSLAVRSPELFIGQPWKPYLPKGVLGGTIQQLLEEASKILESHAVNRVRVDLGENPANLCWLWGAAQGHAQRTFKDCTGFSGALVSTRFPMRGFATSLGLTWKEGLASIEERAFQQLAKVLEVLIEKHDLVYVHLSLETPDPVERLCAMERLDQILLSALTEQLPKIGPWRMLVAIDDRTSGAVPLIAIGSGLPQQPIARLHMQHFAESPLAFEDGQKLFSWLTQDKQTGASSSMAKKRVVSSSSER